MTPTSRRSPTRSSRRSTRRTGRSATRQDGDLWGVGAKRIQVAQIPFPNGEKLELSRTTTTASSESTASRATRAIPPELEADRRGSAATRFYVEAQRIDGDLWEVRAAAF